ncbi:MAG: 2-succinyl-5-enolpyruvyl-6-hydroxy-3-cyclohexene-1-carboxylic-acid synthase [Simkaniaceae bacterium]|nr:2-succinyl-5-enolpyruvyl-6-hydroxy-3-cyclohexene-1-carboxylic-acid synthase [Simkaniaceae bacterium]
MNDHNTSFQNEIWATAIVKELVHHGVRYFCMSPGSRSTPLVEAVAKHPLTETMVHFDERGMAYHALGFAHGSGKAAAIITSSGTAVANLMPAIIEASMRQIPLIILTADRPPELRGIGANQTIDQVKIFNEYVRWHVDLPCPSNKIPLRYVGTTISQATSFANRSPKGPIHINCMFREPFSRTDDGISSSINKTTYRSQVVTLPTKYSIDSEVLHDLAEELSGIDKGLILVGSLPKDESYSAILALAKRLKWPIFPDISSQLRSCINEPEVIPNFDLILKNTQLRKEMRPKAILQFGERMISKKLLEWIDKYPPELYCHITPHPIFHDPIHRITDRIECLPSTFCLDIIPKFTNYNSIDWIDLWREKSDCVKHHLARFFHENNQLSEPSIFHMLANFLTKNHALFIGNSMPIRDAESFYSPLGNSIPIFTQRGASGIDGNIATSIGIGAGLEKPIVAIIGDLTFLHDLNSLSQLQSSKTPAVYIVINNKGGGIFSFLPTINKQEYFEPYFATPHDLDLKHAAKLFKIPYHNPKSIDEFEKTLDLIKENKTSCLVEIRTDRTQNFQLHKDINCMLAKVLESKSKFLPYRNNQRNRESRKEIPQNSSAKREKTDSPDFSV